MSRQWALWVRWGLANGCGLSLGLVLHQGLWHSALSTTQVPAAARLFFETFGLSTAALALCFLQQVILRLFVRVSWRDVVLQTGLTASAFWIGYSAIGMPFPHIVILSTLGTLTGWMLRKRRGEWRRWMWLSSGGFFTATLVEMAASHGFAGNCFSAHILTCTYLGYFAGVASGALTGWQLARSLRPAREESRASEISSLNLLLAR